MTETRRERAPARSSGGRLRQGRSRGAEAQATLELETERENDASTQSELVLARRTALAVPVVTLAGALVVGTLVSLASGILVLTGGALFGTIAFFWASIRTLGGEAPLADGFEQMSLRRVESPDSPAERKKAALRGLKDLELEHALGKIDDGDYAELSARYREEAKAILREIDLGVSPRRARAEEIVRNYLEKRGFGAERPPRSGKQEPALPRAETLPKEERASAPGILRATCSSCSAKNESDAVFCKKCGARLAPVDCPSCSTVNEADALFCKKCGGGLEVKSKECSDASV